MMRPAPIRRPSLILAACALAAGVLAPAAAAATTAPLVAWSSDAATSIKVRPADASAPTRTIAGASGEFLEASDPRISRDGSTVAFLGFPNDGSGDSAIFVVRTDGSAPPAMVPGSGDGFSPAISDDGRVVAWHAFLGDTEVLVGPADGSSPAVNVSDDPESDHDPSLSGDGSLVAWTSRRTGDEEIFVARTDGSGTPVNVSQDATTDRFAALSGDGRSVAWQAHRDVNTETYVAPADGTGVALNLSQNTESDQRPSISQSGGRVAWNRVTGARAVLVRAAAASRPEATASQDATQLYENPRLAPSGRLLVSQRRPAAADDHEVYVFRASGTGAELNLSEDPDQDDVNPDISGPIAIASENAVPPAPTATTAAAAPANCTPAPARGTPAQVRPVSTITAEYLRINQRTGAATVRRANAIEAWLDAGIVAEDLCGGSLAPEDLDSGVVSTSGPLADPPPQSAPRRVEIPEPAPKRVTFTADAIQMCINQRIYQAGIVRANALARRVAALTGGDLRDGLLTQGQLRQDLLIESATAAASPPAASITNVVPPTRKGCDAVSFTPTQAAINRRIAIQSVVRINQTLDLLAAGLTGANFADGTITATDLSADLLL